MLSLEGATSFYKIVVLDGLTPKSSCRDVSIVGCRPFVVDCPLACLDFQIIKGSTIFPDSTRPQKRLCRNNVPVYINLLQNRKGVPELRGPAIGCMSAIR